MKKKSLLLSTRRKKDSIHLKSRFNFNEKNRRKRSCLSVHSHSKNHLHRRPSVMTWVQSFGNGVIGHLNKAPLRFVAGCRFCPNGAPTKILKTKAKKKKRKKMSVELKTNLVIKSDKKYFYSIFVSFFCEWQNYIRS